MGQRLGLDAAVFSLKCFAAAMLATFIAFSIGLERPYWAFLTAYIVSGPLAGAVVSRAMYRLVGTIGGATFAVFIVPPLVQAPVLLVAAMALWLGLCVFLSLLDRSPSSYMFVLAGYSAGLIVWPIVDAPTHIFDVAALRAQEIAIGITCSALVHGLVFPRSVTKFLRGKTRTVLDDAERWSLHILSGDNDPQVGLERRRLSQDISELHTLAAHLPFETSGPAPRVRVVRAIEEKLAEILPLGAAITDRVEALEASGGVPNRTRQLLRETHAWLERQDVDFAVLESEADALLVRCRALEPRIAAASTWTDLLHLNLLVRLSGLIEAHLDCRLLQAQFETQDRRPVSGRIPLLLESIGDRPMHRDMLGAFRAAAGASFMLVTACIIWFATGWQDGATFVMIASVFPALFGGMDNSLGPVSGFFKGTAVSILLGALYGFAILPRVDGFPGMVAALAPVLLVLGAMMTNPKYMGIALPALLGVGGPFIISEQFGADLGPGIPATFAAFVNSQIAMLASIIFAGAMIRLIQTAGVEHATARTLKAGWQDLAERSNRWAAPEVTAWVSRMLDRHAVLAPRLAVLGKRSDEAAYDIMRDLHAGVAVGELRTLRREIDPELQEPVSEVLSAVSGYYSRLVPHETPVIDPDLLARIDGGLKCLAGAQGTVARAAAIPLVSLRRTMFADAPAFVGATKPAGVPS